MPFDQLSQMFALIFFLSVHLTLEMLIFLFHRFSFDLRYVRDTKLDIEERLLL